MEMTFKPEGLAIALGIVLALSWIAFLVGVTLWGVAWRWIDDDKAPRPPNPVIVALMRRMGFTRDRDSKSYPYQKLGGDWDGSISDGTRAVLGPFFGLFASPMVVLLAIRFYPITIFCITIYLLARVARFARRHKKLFDKHLKDPEAHK